MLCICAVNETLSGFALGIALGYICTAWVSSGPAIVSFRLAALIVN